MAVKKLCVTVVDKILLTRDLDIKAVLSNVRKWRNLILLKFLIRPRAEYLKRNKFSKLPRSRAIVRAQALLMTTRWDPLKFRNRTNPHFLNVLRFPRFRSFRLQSATQLKNHRICSRLLIQTFKNMMISVN